MDNEFLNRKARELRRAEAEKSLRNFVKYYFADYTKLPYSPGHFEIYTLLSTISERRGQKVAVAAPRGFGKTTHITNLYLLHRICYSKERFILILSATVLQATTILDVLRRELTDNEKLLNDFPELRGRRPKPWKSGEIVTLNGIKIQAFGTEQQLRGIKFREFRPSLIIADDLENADNTLTQESREKTKELVNRTVLLLGDGQTNYLFLGTLYQPNCLLAELVDCQLNPQWASRVFKAIISWSRHQELWDVQWRKIYRSREAYKDLTGPEAALQFYEDNKAQMDEGVELLWPDRWSYYWLMEQREAHESSFYCELQNEPINLRGNFFNMAEIVYWSDRYRSIEELLLDLGRYVEIYIACDPSVGVDTLRGDYTAIIVLARKGDTFYVLVEDIERRDLDQAIEALLSYAEQFQKGLMKIAVETNQFQEILAQELERRSRARKLWIPLERITNTVEKMKRIQSMSPQIKSGRIQFHRGHIRLLNEIKFYPHVQHDDGLDALEMAIRISEEGIDRQGRVRFI